MRKEQLLKEGQRNKLLESSGAGLVTGINLLSVDIQPEYESAFTFRLVEYLDFLNENHEVMNSITFLYNGADTLGMISESEYIYWLVDNGLNEEVIDSITFYDKGYAFFRNAMDVCGDEDEIVDLVRYMNDNDINDSRDIDNDMWTDFMETYQLDSSDIRELLEFSEDCINIPDLMDFLRNYGSKLVICGGGINECLKEVEIALKAMNKNYNVLTKFTF